MKKAAPGTLVFEKKYPNAHYEGLLEVAHQDGTVPRPGIGLGQGAGAGPGCSLEEKEEEEHEAAAGDGRAG